MARADCRNVENDPTPEQIAAECVKLRAERAALMADNTVKGCGAKNYVPKVYSVGSGRRMLKRIK